MQIVTFKSENVSNEKLTWMALLKNGGIFSPIRFHGNSERDVKNKAKAWLEKQRKPAYHEEDLSEERYEELVAEREAKEANDPKPIPVKKFHHVSEGPGRGVGNVGAIWMANRKTKERARVRPEQIAEYEANGFIKYGPRNPL